MAPAAEVVDFQPYLAGPRERSKAFGSPQPVNTEKRLRVALSAAVARIDKKLAGGRGTMLVKHGGARLPGGDLLVHKVNDVVKTGEKRGMLAPSACAILDELKNATAGITIAPNMRTFRMRATVPLSGDRIPFKDTRSVVEFLKLRKAVRDISPKAFITAVTFPTFDDLWPDSDELTGIKSNMGERWVESWKRETKKLAGKTLFLKMTVDEALKLAGNKYRAYLSFAMRQGKLYLAWDKKSRGRCCLIKASDLGPAIVNDFRTGTLPTVDQLLLVWGPRR